MWQCTEQDSDTTLPQWDRSGIMFFSTFLFMLLLGCHFVMFLLQNCAGEKLSFCTIFECNIVGMDLNIDEIWAYSAASCIFMHLFYYTTVYHFFGLGCNNKFCCQTNCISSILVFHQLFVDDDNNTGDGLMLTMAMITWLSCKIKTEFTTPCFCVTSLCFHFFFLRDTMNLDFISRGDCFIAKKNP